MKNDFTLAFNELVEEKQLPKEIILQALESAMVSAYRRAVNASNDQQVESKIDPDTGHVSIFAEKEVVESVENALTEVTIEEARTYIPEAELGMTVVVDSTPKDFGRVAAQTARQVIQQRIRDAEHHAQLDFYQKQLGEIVSGIVQAVNAQGLTVGLEMRAEASLARKDMIPGERFRIHDRVRSLVVEVKESPRGPQIILSRNHRDFLRRLLENEVPEIYHGVVEIRSISREPGERAKVAVSATQQGIDPVGACVGIRGVRIQAIVRELHDEKIDVIEWNNDPAIFISKAISPARVNGVYLSDKGENGKTATVVVPEDQLSLAIGRDGQNARLAAKLTNWRIDIKSLTEAARDALNKVTAEAKNGDTTHSDETLQLISGMLVKKDEGRPLTPEEYVSMAQFVDRVERKISLQHPVIEKVDDVVVKELREIIPPEIFDQNILDSSLSSHVSSFLQEAGYSTTGELVSQIRKDPDKVFRLQGIGPRAMADITKLMETIFPAPKTEVVETTAEETQPAESQTLQVAAVEKTEVQTPVLETAPEPEAVLETTETTPQVEVPSAEGEEEPSFDKLFSLDMKPEAIAPAVYEEEEDDPTAKSKGKKKKKKQVEITFDPDANQMLVRKKHKRGDGFGWEE
jgi:N utilization substance protein A